MGTYRDRYPDSLTDGEGLISNLSEFRPPWDTLDQSVILSLERSYNIKYGFKELVDSLSFLSDHTLAETILYMFREKWSRYWEDYSLVYNPLSAYKVVESGTDTRTPDLSEIRVKDSEVTTTRDDTGTDENKTLGSQYSQESYYGFNSYGAGVPVTSTEETPNLTELETRNLHDETEEIIDSTDTITKTGSETITHELTKEGNIGYTTPQKLIREEFEIWVKPYFDIVFSDIDNFISLQVY